MFHRRTRRPEFHVPDWQLAGTGACVGGNLNHWVPERKVQTDRQIAICHTCPHQAECLEWALDGNEKGVLGGTTERQRQTIKKRRRDAQHLSN